MEFERDKIMHVDINMGIREGKTIGGNLGGINTYSCGGHDLGGEMN